MPYVDCEYCDKPVKMSPSLIKLLKHYFCNKDCRAAWRLAKRPRIPCDECGTILILHPYQLNHSKRHFCNPTCKGAWQSKNLTGKRAPRWAGGDVSVLCAQCGEILKRQRCAVENRSENFFCNLKCRGEWQSENNQGENHPNWTCTEIFKCDYCGKEKARPRWWAKREQEYRFCNSQCMGEYYKRFTGDARYNWRGGGVYYYGPNWPKQSEKTRERDNHRCCYCGITQKKARRKLDVHHIKPLQDFNYIPDENENYKQANTLTNLITLCQSCHMKAEWGTIAIQLQLF